MRSFASVVVLSVALMWMGMIRLEVDLGTPQSVALVPWQPHFMTAGTRHGYTNTGRSTVSAMEIFVRQ